MQIVTTICENLYLFIFIVFISFLQVFDHVDRYLSLNKYNKSLVNVYATHITVLCIPKDSEQTRYQSGVPVIKRRSEIVIIQDKSLQFILKINVFKR